MGLSKGPWRLRYLIIDRDIDSKNDSNLFLTGHASGGAAKKVVTIVPEGAEWQMWLVYPIEGKEDWYRISPDPEGIAPRNLARKDDSDSVIIASPTFEWRLQYIPINLAGGNVYEIHSNELIGAELLLGKEKINDEAAIQAFVVGYDGPKPAWQFQPVPK